MRGSGWERAVRDGAPTRAVPAHAPAVVSAGFLAVSAVHLGAQLLGLKGLADLTQVLLMPLLAAVIARMALLATGLGALAGVGAAVFVLSDALIALNSFGVLTLPWHGFWVMLTYLGAQTMLVLAVRLQVCARREATPLKG